MDDDVIPFSQLINNTFKNIKCKDVENANVVFDVWKKVLYSIKGMGNSLHPENPYEGQNLYEHSRIVDFKNGMLLIEADHPGWIQLLQMHKQYILNGLNKASPDLHINTIVFKLKGKKAELCNVEETPFSVEQVRSGIQDRVEKEEQLLEQIKKERHIETDGSSGSADVVSFNRNKSTNDKPPAEQKKELPPELAGLFDDLKKSVLTNSKK